MLLISWFAIKINKLVYLKINGIKGFHMRVFFKNFTKQRWKHMLIKLIWILVSSNTNTRCKGIFKVPMFQEICYSKFFVSYTHFLFSWFEYFLTELTALPLFKGRDEFVLKTFPHFRTFFLQKSAGFSKIA